MTTLSALPSTVQTEVKAALPALVQALLNLKGQIATLRTVREMKVKKGRPMIHKESKFQCRIGVNYDNIAAVKEKRETGELPEENAGLPWGEWLVFPYVIAHKGNHYFRCTSLDSTMQTEVRFWRGTQEISKQDAQVDCLASEFYEKDSEVFTVKVESIAEVNGRPV